jgi:hypothetical protein
MKKILIVACISAILVGCNNSGKNESATKDTTASIAPSKTGEEPDARYMVTEQSFGLVPLDADYETLIRTYGKERVTDEKMYRAPDSDEMVMKTIINKDKIDEMVIQWDDDHFHKKILNIEAYRNNHPYKTANGIHCGTTLAELVKINCAKISFSGFGWDFGGLLTDFHGGKLAYKEGKPHIGYSLDLNLTQNYEEILGDQTIDTDMPMAKKYLENIVVKKIDLSPAY